MKRNFKIICLVLAFVICTFFMNLPVYADNFLPSNQPIYCNIEVLEDGSYIIDEIQVITPSSSALAASATTYQKTATRTYTYYDSADRKCWSFILKGTFQYDGSSSKATAASTSYSTYITGWKCSSQNASYSGNIAKGTANFKRLTTSINISIGLKCSSSGTISKVNY